MRILVVEADAETAAYWAGGLEEEGHLVSRAGNGLDGLVFSTTGRFDLLMVNRVLPDLDGLTLVEALRAIGIDTPVLFITTKSAIHDRVAWLNSGGDDYLVKPFTFSELAARVKALAWRTPGTSVETRFKVADLELDLSRHLVKRAGMEIGLRPREFHVLEYLMRHAGQVVTRNMLLENVWNYRFVPHTDVVKTQLSRLRIKVDKGFTPELIHTVRGTGYCLRAPD